MMLACPTCSLLLSFVLPTCNAQTLGFHADGRIAVDAGGVETPGSGVREWVEWVDNGEWVDEWSLLLRKKKEKDKRKKDFIWCRYRWAMLYAWAQLAVPAASPLLPRSWNCGAPVPRSRQSDRTSLKFRGKFPAMLGEICSKG